MWVFEPSSCDFFFYMGTEMSHDRVFLEEDQQVLRGTVQQHENQQHFKVILHRKSYYRIGGDSTLLTNYRNKKKQLWLKEASNLS